MSHFVMLSDSEASSKSDKYLRVAEDASLRSA